MKTCITGSDLDYSEKPYHRSALWEATWKSSSVKEAETLVKELVQAGATIAHADYQGRTPLHEAAYYGNLELVKFFVEKGHEINCKDIFDQTPLFRAVEAGRSEVVGYLQEKGATINLTDIDKINPAHQAAFRGMPDMSHWLLYHGAWKNRYHIEDDGPVMADDAELEAEEPESPT